MASTPPRYHALLVEARSETPLLRHLSLEAPKKLREAHRLPGQFVEAALGRNEQGAYFALANPPGAHRFELLVKKGEGIASDLWASGPGRSLWLSEPMGPGFRLEEARGKDLLLFATGSGFAPIRALLLSILERRQDFGEIHLFFGVRTKEDFPFVEELAKLPERGVQTHLTVSRQPEELRGRQEAAPVAEPSQKVREIRALAGRGKIDLPERPLSTLARGRYVQERFLEVMPPVDNAVAYLCGIEGMVEGVREALGGAGMPSDRIHVNL